MVSGSRRYGIVHTYESWYFCKRTEEGELKISRPFTSSDTSPSVFHAIKTLNGLEDHILAGAHVHPSSASEAPPKKLTRDNEGNLKRKTPPSGFPPYHPGNRTSEDKGPSGDGKGSGSTAGIENLASSLFLWECELFDSTDTIQLLTIRKDPSILVKLQRDSRQIHVAEHMAREAEMYEALALRHDIDLSSILPRFYGYSTHLGVAMTCVDREMDDFDDIGLENLSDSLKESAVCGVKALSEAGVLHNDIELRNIVQCRNDPTCAKIIDLGRAVFSKDHRRLTDQVERVKFILGLTTRSGEVAASQSVEDP